MRVVAHHSEQALHNLRALTQSPGDCYEPLYSLRSMTTKPRVWG